MYGEWVLMDRRVSWAEQQVMPAGLDAVFRAFMRGEARAREQRQ